MTFSCSRALLARPRLLLLDEPSLGLAPLVVADIVRMLAEINAAGVSILLVEQGARLALKLARHVYLMERGRVTFSGDPSHVAHDEVVNRAYFGRSGRDAMRERVDGP